MNNRNRQIVQENEAILNQLIRVKKGAIEQKKMRKEMQNRIEIYERRKALERKSTVDESSVELNKSGFAAKKPTTPARTDVRQRRVNSAQSFSFQNKTQLFDPKISKRMHHPSSKLILDPENRTHDFIGLSAGIVEPKLLKRQNEKPEEFALKIHSSLKLKNPSFFAKYYAGGPSKYDLESGSVSLSDLKVITVDYKLLLGILCD